MKADTKLKSEDVWRGSLALKKILLTREVKNSLMKKLKSKMKDWERLSNDNLKRFE